VKLIVTGAAGQLGTDLVRYAMRAGDDVVVADRSTLDITDALAVRSFVEAHRPDAIINAAAYTAVDACETNQEMARAVNAEAVGSLRDAADATDAHLVHVSTDYVFDGTLDRPYVEDDTPNPQSVYGVTKLEGEGLAGDGASVVRTSWVCGEYGNNMVKLILRLAGGDAPLAFVDDQRGCPTFTADLAPALHRLASDRHAGTFHLTNAGAVSWYEFVSDILEAAGHERSGVMPIGTADLDPPRPAPRPANGVLDNAAWRDAGHRPLRHYREPLAELVGRLT
jgi:dTDP-4-dehydrorhamnose reductase